MTTVSLFVKHKQGRYRATDNMASIGLIVSRKTAKKFSCYWLQNFVESFVLSGAAFEINFLINVTTIGLHEASSFSFHV